MSMPPLVLVFDCDGVILESVDVKTSAFARIAEPYGQEAQDRLVLYHTLNGGVNRIKKFEWFFAEVLGKPLDAATLADLNQRYSKYAYDGVLNAPLVNGLMETLDLWNGVFPMYVCSGAPHDELNIILAHRKLHTYFEGIYGAPPAKSILLQRIVDSVNVPPDHVIMIGDSGTDLDAAEHARTRFYGRGPTFANSRWPHSADLVNFNTWLQKEFEG